MAVNVQPGLQAQERRKYPRVQMKMAVNYKSLTKGEVSRMVKSRSEDFSAGGIAMQSAQKMRRGQLLMLNLFIPISGRMVKNGEVPDYTKSRCQTAAILSRVAYCTKISETYKLGVQFLDLEKNHRKLLRSFLVKCQLLTAKSRLYS